MAMGRSGGSSTQHERLRRRDAPRSEWAVGRIAADGARRARSDLANDAGLVESLLRLSLLQVRAHLQGLAEGPAHPPFRPLGTPRCPGKCGELPSLALLLGLCQHLAVPFVDELGRPIRG